MGDSEADEWWLNVAVAQDQIGEECGTEEAASKAVKAAEIEFILQQQQMAQKMEIDALKKAGIPEEAQEEDAGAAAGAGGLAEGAQEEDAGAAAGAGGLAEGAAAAAAAEAAAAALLIEYGYGDGMYGAP